MTLTVYTTPLQRQILYIYYSTFIIQLFAKLHDYVIVNDTLLFNKE